MPKQKTKAAVKVVENDGKWMIVGTYFTGSDGKIHDGVDVVINTNDPMYDELVTEFPKDIRPFKSADIDLEQIDEAISKPSIKFEDNDFEKL